MVGRHREQAVMLVSVICRETLKDHTAVERVDTFVCCQVRGTEVSKLG